jgi:tetratricopeptide (TPR) repeat protein
VIVPVHTPTFDYGDIERLLPESLAHDLQRFNGQELPHRWFKFAVQELVEEFLVPIELENVAPPAADQPVVDRLREEAKAALTVTETQLSAQEYFERALARGKNDLGGMITDYSEAIRLDPKYARAFNNRGIARLIQKGDLERALSDLDEAIRLDPHDANAYFNRALVRWGRGELAGAIADAEQGAVYAPEDEDFPRLLASLKAQV